MMAGEVALSPSQVKEDGQWQPIGHKTIPSYRSSPPLSIPPRLSSVTSKIRRKPLSTINEDRPSSVKSDSSDGLKLISTLPHQPPTWNYSSERLVYISPSHQLQESQSVGYGSVYNDNKVDKAYWRVYKTQRRWTTRPVSYVPSGTPKRELMTVETNVASALDTDDLLESEEHPVTVDGDLPRDAIADLFHRVEKYEQENPENTKGVSKVWVRVNEVGQGLTKKLKTMGSLRKKPTFEARLNLDPTDNPTTPSGIVPFQSQGLVYKKPTQIKRLRIIVSDCWKRLGNWSRDTGTELPANHNGIDYPVTNVSIVSFNLHEPFTTRSRSQRNTLPRTPDLAGRSDGTVPGPVRRDSKRSVSDKEQLRRRKSSLFLDVD